MSRKRRRNPRKPRPPQQAPPAIIPACAGGAACEPRIVFHAMGRNRCHSPGFWPEIGWMCWHRELCQWCGRVLRENIPDTECPDFPHATDLAPELATALPDPRATAAMRGLRANRGPASRCQRGCSGQ